MLRRVLLFALLALSSLPAFAQKERHFTFHYSFTVSARTKEYVSGFRSPIPTLFRT
jgi:hypothetical protein